MTGGVALTAEDGSIALVSSADVQTVSEDSVSITGYNGVDVTAMNDNVVLWAQHATNGVVNVNAHAGISLVAEGASASDIDITTATGLSRFCRGIFSIGRPAFTAMAWIFIPAYCFTIP